MKSLFVAFMCGFFTAIACGQDGSSGDSPRLGIGLGKLYTTNIKSFAVNPYITYNLSNFKIGTGLLYGKAPFAILIPVYGNSPSSFTRITSRGRSMINADERSIFGANVFFQFRSGKRPSRLIEILYENRTVYMHYQGLIQEDDYYYNIHSFENYSGICLRVNISKRLQFYNSGAVGLQFQLGEAPSTYTTSTDTENSYNPVWFGLAYHAGLEYKFSIR